MTSKQTEPLVGIVMGSRSDWGSLAVTCLKDVF